MTLKRFHECITEMLQEHPDWASLPCIYSTDDEGNEYNMVNNEPTAAHVDNPEAYRFLEMTGYWNGVDGDGDIAEEDVNCIIIN